MNKSWRKKTMKKPEKVEEKKFYKKLEKKVDKSWKVVEKKVGRYVFFGQVMSSHHSDQMSQRSQVSRIAPFGCSLMEVHR